jgi:hypothetical protein
MSIDQLEKITIKACRAALRSPKTNSESVQDFALPRQEHHGKRLVALAAGQYSLEI